MEVTLGQQIPTNTTIMDSVNIGVGTIPNTETPPPGYMSEDGDPLDQNDNMSESKILSVSTFALPNFSIFLHFYFTIISQFVVSIWVLLVCGSRKSVCIFRICQIAILGIQYDEQMRVLGIAISGENFPPALWIHIGCDSNHSRWGKVSTGIWKMRFDGFFRLDWILTQFNLYLSNASLCYWARWGFTKEIS